MAVAQSALSRFVVFLTLMALLFGYVAWKWRDFQRQTATEGKAAPLVVAPGRESLPPPAASPAAPAAAPAPASEAFFTEGRMERDRARSQQMELLKELIAQPQASAEARARAEAELLALSRRAAQEAEIENLLRARGFRDALVYLYSNSAVVVVRAGSLTPAQVAQVADAVSRVAGIPFESVSVLAKPD